MHVEFYVSSNLKICMRKQYHSSLDSLLRRHLTVGDGLYDQNTFANKDLPFVYNLEPKFSCGWKMPGYKNYNARTCRAILPLNNSHSVCSHVWVRYPEAFSCPSDYAYRKDLYLPEDVCVPITTPNLKSDDKEDGGWLHRALSSVVLWTLTLTDKLSNFVVLVLKAICNILFILMSEFLDTIHTTFEQYDKKYTLFEFLLLLLVVVYRSNLPAGVLFTVVYGLTVGFKRSGEFRLHTSLFSE